MTENQKKSSTDFTGLVILAMVAPLYIFFAYIGKQEMGRAACVCLGMVLLAIRIRWELRGQIWFWGVIVFLLILHVPLILFVPWPSRWIPAIGILPIGVLDCLIFLGAIWLVEKWRK